MNLDHDHLHSYASLDAERLATTRQVLSGLRSSPLDDEQKALVLRSMPSSVFVDLLQMATS